MNRIDYIYPTALEQIKAAINGDPIPSNDGNRDGMVNDVRYFSKAALDQIAESFGDYTSVVNNAIAKTALPDDGSVHFVVLGPSSVDPLDPTDPTKMKFTCMGDIEFKKTSIPNNPYYFNIKTAQIDAVYQRWVAYKDLSAELAYILSSVVFVPVYGVSPLVEGTEYTVEELEEMNDCVFKDYPLGFQINAVLSQQIKTKIEGEDAWPFIESQVSMGPISNFVPGFTISGWGIMYQGAGQYIDRYYMTDDNATTFYMNVGFSTELGSGATIQFVCSPTRPEPGVGE